MELYRRALVLLLNIMINVGADYWVNYIEENIKEWDELNKVDGHLNAYHKEGLPDYWISSKNGHSINPKFEPWVNEIKNNVCLVASKCGKGIKDKMDCDDIDFIMDEIVLSKKKYSSYHPLIAWVCKECGNITFTSRYIEYTISSLLSPEIVRQHFKSNLEFKLTDYNYIKNLEMVDFLRDKVFSEIKNMKYKHINNIDESWSCNKCHCKDYLHMYFEILENGGNLIIRQKD